MSVEDPKGAPQQVREAGAGHRRSLAQVDPALASGDFGDASSAARRVEVAVAGARGDESTVRSHLGDEAARVRLSAYTALVNLGVLDADELVGALRDPSPLVCRALAELAPHIEGASVAELLSDKEEVGVLEAACFAAGELGERAALPALLEIAARHRDPLCREAAVAALGVLGAEEGRPVLLAALSDRPEIRRRAVIALGAFRGADVREALHARRSDRDWQVRQAAEDLLAIIEVEEG
jgi:HEAT repeat protein